MKNSIIYYLLFILLLMNTINYVYAQITVMDDSHQIVTLPQAAKRVISLSPGLTELIFAAGGGQYLKGVVTYSDYPPEAKHIQRVGSYNALDIEQILMLQTDLIIAWQSGNPKHQIEQLKKFGIPVYLSEPGDFEDIAATILQLGKLMATEQIARQSAQTFLTQYLHLKQQYQLAHNQAGKSTFIQIWNKPLMTVNQAHLISKVISLCGGNNIFADNISLTSTPDIESILAANPQVIIATGMADSSKQWLKRWRQWPYLNAVKNQQLFAVNPDHLVRHTPRILLGIKEVCSFLQP